MAQVNDSFQLSFINTSNDSVPISLFQLGSDDPNSLRRRDGYESTPTGTTTGLPNTGVITTNYLCFADNEINSSGVFLKNGVFGIEFATFTESIVFSTSDTLELLIERINVAFSIAAAISIYNPFVTIVQGALTNIGGTNVFPITFSYYIDSDAPKIGTIPINIKIQSDVSAVRTFPYTGLNRTQIVANNYQPNNANVTISGTDDYGEILQAQNGNTYEVYYIYGLAPQGGSDIITIDRLDSNGEQVVNSFTPVIDPKAFQRVYQINPKGEQKLRLNGRSKLSLTLAPNSRTLFEFYYKNLSVQDALTDVVTPLETDEGFTRDNSKQKDFTPKVVLELDYENPKVEKEQVDFLKKAFNIKIGGKENKKLNIIIPIILGVVALRMAK